MPERIRVFISSKEAEFRTQRQELRDALNGTEMFEVTLVEDLPPTRLQPEQIYLGAVRESHIYIGLFGCVYSEPTKEEYDAALSNPARELLIYEADCPQGRDPRLAAFVAEIKRSSMTRKIGANFVATVLKHLNASLITIVRRLVDSGNAPRTLGSGPAQRQWAVRRRGLIELGLGIDEPAAREETIAFYRTAADRVLTLR